MSVFDPGQWHPLPEDPEPLEPGELTVEWEEPKITATLFDADGAPLIEITDRSPAGYR